MRKVVPKIGDLMDEDRIRVRAYFHFENRTGRNWADPVSNWLQAAEQERAIEFFDELGRRVSFIRSLYRRHRIVLKPGEGLALALDEAEALARGDKAKGPFAQQQLIRSASDAHVIYAIAGSLQTCVSAGLDVSKHLPNLTTGTTDYGTSSTNLKSIFFKDFEFETFIASALIRNGLVPAFAEPGDPSGDLILDGILIEAKHPNSVGQLTKLLLKFNTALEAIGHFGVFAVALEDAMEMGDVSEFDSQAEYEAWIAAKRGGMEAIGQRLIPFAAHLPRIAALLQSQTKVEIVGGGTTLRRLGSSILFDHRPSFPNYETTARAIAASFNPNPVLYSAL
jgi:hypothetical protein